MDKKSFKNIKNILIAILVVVFVTSILLLFLKVKNREKDLDHKFFDQTTGISFSYPLSFPDPKSTFDENKKLSKISFENISYNDKEKEISNVVIYVYPALKNGQLEAHSYNIQAAQRQNYPGIEQTSETRATISGFPAVKQYYSLGDDKNFSELIYLVFDDKLVEIQRYPVWPSLDKDFDKFVQSINLQSNYLIISKWNKDSSLVLRLPYGAVVENNKIAFQGSQFWIDRTSPMRATLCSSTDFEQVCGADWDYILVDKDTPKIRPIDTIEKISKWHRGSPSEYFALEPQNIKVGGLGLNHFIIYKNKPSDVFTYSEIEQWKEWLRTIQEVKELKP